VPPHRRLPQFHYQLPSPARRTTCHPPSNRCLHPPWPIALHADFRGGSTGGARGIKPPYLPKIHGYPHKLPLHFLEETMKKKTEEEEEKGRKKKRGKMTPLFIFFSRFITGCLATRDLTAEKQPWANPIP